MSVCGRRVETVRSTVQDVSRLNHKPGLKMSNNSENIWMALWRRAASSETPASMSADRTWTKYASNKVFLKMVSCILGTTPIPKMFLLKGSFLPAVSHPHPSLSAFLPCSTLRFPPCLYHQVFVECWFSVVLNWFYRNKNGPRSFLV